MPKHGTAKLFFFSLILIYAVYAGVFIYNTSFVIDGQRCYSLFDDAMISMRYAQNLAHGDGLIWNPDGEKVEGFTNPLWVLFMTVFHLFPISPAKISLCIQISGALFLLVNLFLVRSISRNLFSGDEFYAHAAVFLTAFYLPLNNWALQGMEVSLLTLLISLVVYLMMRSLKSKRFNPWIYLILGIGIWVRMDMAVPYLIVWLFLVISDRSSRPRHIGWGLSLFALSILSQTLFRWWYYGDLLPNTYYLKMTGYPLMLRWSRGAAVAWQFIKQINISIFLLPFLSLFFRRNRATILLISLFIGQMLYSIHVGGDAWEYWGGSNRYITIVMPLFFILLGGWLWAAEEWLAERLKTESNGSRLSLRMLSLLIILIAFLKMNTVFSPTPSLKELFLQKPVLAVTDNREMVECGLRLKEYTTPQAKIAVVWAGAIPYFSDRPCIDMLGKNDRVIARQKAHLSDGNDRYTAFYPGHMKWDYDYSIGQLKPDVITQFYGVTAEEAEEYMGDEYRKVDLDGFVWELRKGSPEIFLTKVNLKDKYFSE
ncbi:MAG: glycosyltransferase family 39 protein [bacterium]|nr:glycosyltransferase family 39 protein [bacterium]